MITIAMWEGEGGTPVLEGQVENRDVKRLQIDDDPAVVERLYVNLAALMGVLEAELILQAEKKKERSEGA